MTDEEIFKKLQIARDAWGQGYPAKGYSPYMSPSAGQEGYEDILKLKLDSLKAGYGKDAKYGYGDPMKHFTNPDEIKTLLEYEIVDNPLPPLIDAPSHFDMMSKDGVPRTTEGTSLGTSSVDLMGPAGLLEGPETANMQLSPYELTLLAENQQRHPSGPPPLSGVSDTDYPRFPASDQAQMGRYITKSDRSDPNFFAPKGFSPGGLLDEVNPIQADRDAYIANATKPKSFLSRNRRSILNEPQSVKPVKRNNLLEDETGWEQNPYFWSTLIDRGLDFGFNE